MTSAGKIPRKVTADEIKDAFRNNLHSKLGRIERFATKNDLYLALALTVRDQHFFLFGLTAQEVAKIKACGYRSRDYCEQNPALREVIDLIASGAFSGGDRELFRPIVDNLLNDDPFLLLADYQSYIEAQERVSALWRNPQGWTRSSILNTARMGKFSSHRSIRDYCERIWNIKPGSR